MSFFLFFGADDVQFIQLLLFHKRGSAHHQVLGVFVHGEWDDLPDGVLSSQQDPEIMIEAFQLVRLGEEDVKAKFPAMYNAFTYGRTAVCPPSGPRSSRG